MSTVRASEAGYLVCPSAKVSPCNASELVPENYLDLYYCFHPTLLVVHRGQIVLSSVGLVNMRHSMFTFKYSRFSFTHCFV